MIGKFIVFVAVAVSCSTALPFGSCGNWDTPAFGNFVGGSANMIPAGLNLPGPAPMIEGPPFPANNIIPGNNIITQGIPNGLPPFPAPSVSGPAVSGPIVGGIQRFSGPVAFPNIPFQGQLVQTSPIQNIERVPTIQTRFPTIQARFQPLDAGLQGFPNVQGAGVFQGGAPQFPC